MVQPITSISTGMTIGPADAPTAIAILLHPNTIAPEITKTAPLMVLGSPRRRPNTKTMMPMSEKALPIANIETGVSCQPAVKAIACASLADPSMIAPARIRSEPLNVVIATSESRRSIASNQEAKEAEKEKNDGDDEPQVAEVVRVYERQFNVRRVGLVGHAAILADQAGDSSRAGIGGG